MTEPVSTEAVERLEAETVVLEMQKAGHALWDIAVEMAVEVRSLVAERDALRRDWADLIGRLGHAEVELQRVLASTVPPDTRLLGKAQGIALAIDYMRGYAALVEEGSTDDHR